MKCKIRLCGSLEDFKPKFDKLKPEDCAWINRLFERERKNPKHLSMNLDEVIKFLTMFNEVEKIYFEVR